MSNMIECGTCGYPLTPEERTTLIEHNGRMVKPEEVTDRELMQQALEALEQWNTPLYKRGNLITALRERLAQPEQEPVAWRNAALRVGEDLCSVGPFGYYDMTAEQWLDWALSVVTAHAPPRRELVGLTDEEIAEAGKLWVEGERMLPFAFAHAIEAKLREKNA